MLFDTKYDRFLHIFIYIYIYAFVFSDPRCAHAVTRARDKSLRGILLPTGFQPGS